MWKHSLPQPGSACPVVSVAAMREPPQRENKPAYRRFDCPICRRECELFLGTAHVGNAACPHCGGRIAVAD